MVGAMKQGPEPLEEPQSHQRRDAKRTAGREVRRRSTNAARCLLCVDALPNAGAATGPFFRAASGQSC